ncbi:MAG: DMT family transporter [Clostridium sp.]
MGAKLKSNILLLLTAAIWGFSFVAQRLGMEYIGAFTFNGIRFAFGGFSLLPLILFYKNNNSKPSLYIAHKSVFIAGTISGLILFLGSSFQQVGLIGTTAGKAAFITGLYIIIVPILGVFLKQRLGINYWVGSILAIIGLYFLCVTNGFSVSYSDYLELIGAFFFAVHIVLIDYLSSKYDVLKLAFFQFITCSFLSLLVAVFFETITMDGILKSMLPILYGGILSVGVAYTLQIVAQKSAEPSHAAIILSMESVFAAIGGFIILNETLIMNQFLGCLLMFLGIIVSQVDFKKLITNNSISN